MAYTGLRAGVHAHGACVRVIPFQKYWINFDPQQAGRGEFPYATTIKAISRLGDEKRP